MGTAPRVHMLRKVPGFFTILATKFHLPHTIVLPLHTHEADVVNLRLVIAVF